MAIKKINYFIETIRPYNMVSGVLLFTIGFFFKGGHVITWNYFIGIITIMFLFAFATIQNDIEDINIDKINAPNKAISSGKLDLKEASIVNTIILVIILLLGLYNFPHNLFFIISALSLTWLYNKPPFYLSRKPFSSMFVMAVMYSSLPFWYGYSLYYSFTFTNYLLYLILFWFLIRISVSILKDFKDVEGDKLYNKRTFYLAFGEKYTALVSIITFCLGSTGIMYLLFTTRGYSWLFILPILFLLKNLYLRLKLLGKSDTKKLTDLFHSIFFGQNQFDIFYLLCIILLK
jgi:4-hydroxybenzoate polyprenyltransferase